MNLIIVFITKIIYSITKAKTTNGLEDELEGLERSNNGGCFYL